MILLGALSSDWKIIIGAFGGVLLGALLAAAGLTDRERVKAALKLQDRALVNTVLVLLLTGLVLRYWAVRLDWLSAAALIEPARLGSVLFGGLLVGIGLNLAGVTPLSALGALGGGRFSALWALIGMALAFPLLDFGGEKLDDFLARWDYRLGTGRFTAEFFSSANPALYATIALAVLIAILAFGGKKN